AGLGHAEAPLIGGGSDASSTAAMGIPSIDGLGPRGSGFHTKEELIEVGSLVPKAEALAAFLPRRRARPVVSHRGPDLTPRRPLAADEARSGPRSNAIGRELSTRRRRDSDTIAPCGPAFRAASSR